MTSCRSSDGLQPPVLRMPNASSASLRTGRARSPCSSIAGPASAGRRPRPIPPCACCVLPQMKRNWPGNCAQSAPSATPNRLIVSLADAATRPQRPHAARHRTDRPRRRCLRGHALHIEDLTVRHGPHPALRATFSRKREKGLCRVPLPPQAGEGCPVSPFSHRRWEKVPEGRMRARAPARVAVALLSAHRPPCA